MALLKSVRHITDTLSILISRFVSLKRVFGLEELVTIFASVILDDTPEMMSFNVVFYIGWKLGDVLAIIAATHPFFILPHFRFNKTINL